MWYCWQINSCNFPFQNVVPGRRNNCWQSYTLQMDCLYWEPDATALLWQIQYSNVYTITTAIRNSLRWLKLFSVHVNSTHLYIQYITLNTQCVVSYNSTDSKVLFTQYHGSLTTIKFLFIKEQHFILFYKRVSQTKTLKVEHNLEGQIFPCSGNFIVGIYCRNSCTFMTHLCYVYKKAN